jgi:hypothetical protein
LILFAFLTQLFVLHGDVIHTLVFIAAMGSVALISREQGLHDLGTGRDSPHTGMEVDTVMNRTQSVRLSRRKGV